MSNGINGALIAQSGKVCYNIDASIRDKAFRMVFIRLSEFYQVQYTDLSRCDSDPVRDSRFDRYDLLLSTQNIFPHHA